MVGPIAIQPFYDAVAAKGVVKAAYFLIVSYPLRASLDAIELV